MIALVEKRGVGLVGEHGEEDHAPIHGAVTVLLGFRALRSVPTQLPRTATASALQLLCLGKDPSEERGAESAEGFHRWPVG